MKKLIVILLLLIPAVRNLSAQTEKQIKAEIKHVTVFPDRAQINHETSLSLSPGK